MTRLLGTDPSARTAAPAGMREAVMRAGLRRRRRFAFAGAGSAGAVALVLAAALLAGTAAGRDALRIEQPATNATPDGSAGTDADSASRAIDGLGAGGSPGAAGFGGPGGQGRGEIQAPAPSARPSASASPRPGNHGPMTRREPEFAQRVCSGDGVSVGTNGVSSGSDWCLEVTGPDYRDSTPNPTPPLTLSICRSMAKDSGALTFDTGQEVDFEISVAGGTNKLWRWSSGQRFASKRHVLYRGSGQCFEWETLWHWQDDRGRPVPSGRTLRLTAWSTSRELGHLQTSTEFASPARQP
jgi:hypothetical protein